jgi:hypothetical protein
MPLAVHGRIRIGGLAMHGERYVVMTVECSRCKTKQKIHVALRTEPKQVGDQTIPCVQCDLDFNVTVPDKIIRGPFPA